MLVAVGTSSVVYGMEDWRFLNEITFTSWLDKQKDTSTMHRILGLFHNVMSRQLVHNAVTIIRILKLYNNAMSGKITIGCHTRNGRYGKIWRGQS